jgi:hypothetical protein
MVNEIIIVGRERSPLLISSSIEPSVFPDRERGCPICIDFPVKVIPAKQESIV